MSERIDAIYYDDAHRLPRSGWVGVEVDLIEVSTFQIRFKWFRSKLITYSATSHVKDLN
jgi:hypothetical protein